MLHKVIFISYLLLFGSTFATKTSISTEPDFYGVIFGITLNKGGELIDLRVARVMDPRFGPDSDVKLEVSNVFIEKAREQIIAKGYTPKIVDGKPTEFFTYFIYDPNRPNRIDIDPRKD